MIQGSEEEAIEIQPIVSIVLRERILPREVGIAMPQPIVPITRIQTESVPDLVQRDRVEIGLSGRRLPRVVEVPAVR